MLKVSSEVRFEKSRARVGSDSTFMCMRVRVPSDALFGRVAMAERPAEVTPVQWVRDNLVSAGKESKLESLNAVDGMWERTRVFSAGRDRIVRSKSFGGLTVAPKWQCTTRVVSCFQSPWKSRNIRDSCEDKSTGPQC